MAVPAGASPPAAQAQWPLIGRRQEMDFVLEALDPPRHGVLLAGASGVGKTRLAREVLVRAAEGGRPTRTLTATPATADVPFGAVGHLLPRGAGPDLQSAAIMGPLTDALLAGAVPGQVVVAVDDAHHLDEMSAAFVHHLATTGAAPLVVTARSGEPAPAGITALYKDGLVDRLEIQQLARDEIRELLGRVLGGDVAEPTLADLWATSAGNVLYLRELVLDALDAGSLVARDGVWRWSGEVGPATRLKEVVGSRLAGLSGVERDVLELLAVGEPLGASLLEALVPGTRLEEVEGRGLIEISLSGRRVEVRLAHPLYGEVLQAGMGGYRRRRLSLMLADRMEEAGHRRSSDGFRLSLWRVESGTAHNAGRLAAAAEHANRIHDPAAAELLARASLQLEASFPASLQLGAALVDQARFEEADRVLAALDPASGDDAGRRGLAYYRMRSLFYGLGRPDEADAALAAIESAVADRGTALTVRGWRAMVQSHAGHFGPAAEIARDLVASDDRRARLVGMPTIVQARYMEGRIDEAVTLGQECLTLAEGVAGRVPVPVGSLQVLTLTAAGRLAEADRLAAGLCPIDGRSHRKPSDLALVDTLRANVCLLAGRPRSALRLLRQSVSVLRDHDSGGFLEWCLSQQVEAAALVGDLATARAAHAEATALLPSGVRMFGGASARARAWYPGVSGVWSAAAAALVEVAEGLADRGERTEAVRALHDAVRLGAGPGAARRLVALAREVDGAFAAAVAAHAEALAGRSVDGLEEAAAAFHAGGHSLLAAEAAAEAAGVAGAAGLTKRAAAAHRRAVALAAECEGARTVRLMARGPADSLTRREREVADLAAAGLTNREIADRLFTSVRTVESHLQQVYVKLGVNSRSSLSAALVQEQAALASRG